MKSQILMRRNEVSDQITYEGLERMAEMLPPTFSKPKEPHWCQQRIAALS